MEPSQTISNVAFIANMINTCIGIGLLAKPYAVMITGWYSIISVGLAYLFITYSGYIFSKITFKALTFNQEKTADSAIKREEMIRINSVRFALSYLMKAKKSIICTRIITSK